MRQCPTGRGARSADGGFAILTLQSKRASHNRFVSQRVPPLIPPDKGESNSQVAKHAWNGIADSSYVGTAARAHVATGGLAAICPGMVAERSNMVKIFRFLFVCAVMLAIAGCGFVGITLWYFGRDLDRKSVV